MHIGYEILTIDEYPTHKGLDNSLDGTYQVSRFSTDFLIQEINRLVINNLIGNQIILQ